MSFHTAYGTNGTPCFMRQLAIFLQVGGAPHDASRHGPLIDSEFQHHEQVHADESNQQSGDNKNVQREESRKRRARNDRPAEHEIHRPRPDHRNPACDRCPDAQSPVGVLVESQ